ncbi:polyhydroxyalkanoate depolymerase [Paraburkholderia aromaticivorans]|uniref:Polyhydroxyalkanoate depolymerase n=1 Tax=Paraburkholderia aromaticivorans TaxID=2026199 RepID=A0A248VJS3_9BURK|nr:polyhydroxyalkanoate depolymerase [Paraburkholderia aromaticivorans]ASV99084.1 polyhydroxyalkanoate depolymerase [Paraburkholderia aromaticivorans]
MWYAWLETQRNLMRMLGAWNLPAVGGSTEPGESRATAVGYDWLYRLIQPPTEPPPFDITTVRIGARDIPVVEQVIERTPFCTLRKFSRAPDAAALLPEQGGETPAIFLCAPLAGHHAVMLREAVEALLQDSDVYVTDWANARDVPLDAGPFGLDDYVLVIQRFLRAAGGSALHIVAVCQATGPALAATALAASAGEAPARSITLAGGPIDARIAPTQIGRFARTHSPDWFRNMAIDTVPPPHPGAGRRVYPGFIQHAAFVAANPERQWALESSYWAAQCSGDERAIASARRRLNEYAAVLDMTEDYFLDSIRVFFQECSLACGNWQVGPHPVRPQDIVSTALCTVEGARDDITGAGQTHAAQTLCSGIASAMRQRLTVENCDHYDLFTGPKWHDVIHPALAAFWRSIR